MTDRLRKVCSDYPVTHTYITLLNAVGWAWIWVTCH